jgi:hypothetical protein
MFGRAFVSQVLAPAATGNPALLAVPARWAGTLIAHDVAVWNAVFALIQLAIGAGLLWRPTVRAALAASAAWGLSVWWLGEGLGGVLTGSASPVTGAPGAAVLYALAAAAAWPPRTGRGSSPAGRGTAGRGSVAGMGLLGRRWGVAAWLVLWGGLACLMVQSAVRAPRALATGLRHGAAGEPGWLAALDRAAASAVASHGSAVCLLAAAVFAMIAVGITIPAAVRPALLLAAAAGLVIWAVGEDFGQVFTGTATDPNSGPLLVLLAAAYWPLRPAPGTAVGPRPARPSQDAAGPPPRRWPAAAAGWPQGGLDSHGTPLARHGAPW